MKKGFFSLVLNAILIASLISGLVRAEQKEKKDKVQIIVAEKKNKERPDNGNQTKTFRREGQQYQQ